MLRLWGYQTATFRNLTKQNVTSVQSNDGAAIDPDDGAADVPVVVVTLAVICSVLLYYL